MYLIMLVLLAIFGPQFKNIGVQSKTADKILVHPITGETNFIRPPAIRPTSATVEHKPGIPPGWPDPGKTSTTFKRPFNFFRPTRTPNYSPNETTFPPLVFNPNYTNSEMKGPDRGFIDWALGLVGIQSQTENPSTVEPPKNCDTCTCGLTFKQNRIVGGIVTKVNQYPWMVALKYNNRFYCGASLINNRYLLTAAHCVSGFQRERLSATFLDHDRSSSFDTQTFTRKIRKVLRHGAYGVGGNYNNDIALLQLDQDVQLSGLLRPVCLPPTGKSFTGSKGIAIGWGATAEHGTVSNVLREVQVPIMSNNDCRRTGYSYRITENMMCAGYPRGMKDSCQGDSGGPLQVVNGTQHQVVGVVSWGEGCAQPNYPGVYTRVNRYISWIKSNTRDACYC